MKKVLFILFLMIISLSACSQGDYRKNGYIYNVGDGYYLFLIDQAFTENTPKFELVCKQTNETILEGFYNLYAKKDSRLYLGGQWGTPEGYDQEITEINLKTKEVKKYNSYSELYDTLGVSHLEWNCIQASSLCYDVDCPYSRISLDIYKSCKVNSDFLYSDEDCKFFVLDYIYDNNVLQNQFGENYEVKEIENLNEDIFISQKNDEQKSYLVEVNDCRFNVTIQRKESYYLCASKQWEVIKFEIE